MLITYLPREGDPTFTKWKGHKLEANVPKEINDPEICALAPKNPWFKCEGKGVDPAAEAKKALPAPGWDMRVKPKSADDYCAYAIAWINRSLPDPADDDAERARINCLASMRRRWDEEAELRAALGVGEDDLDKINGIYAPKLAQFGG